tara:strand:+ start:287 stop:616 length:330 start_codon:yes stop_codon:yes gene_type:complete
MANRKKNVNGVEIELTDKEQAELEKRENEWAKGELNRELNWLRTVRNSMLAESDYMGNSDVTMSDAWKTYRQKLRDITQGLTTVTKVKNKMKFDEDTKTFVNFPKKPTE